jgi:hypothetical protein
MFEISNASTFWVDLTNIALGIATLVCFVIVVYAAVREVVVRVTQRSNAHAKAHSDAHVFEVPELGLTMTDGGEKLYDDDERAFG